MTKNRHRRDAGFFNSGASSRCRFFHFAGIVKMPIFWFTVREARRLMMQASFRWTLQ
jgi:hypothetical protein